MKEEKKQRKFHDALLKMLYPPPPSPPSDQEDDEQEEEEKNLIEPLSDLPEEELENDESCSLPSSGDNNEGENGSDDQKLTRAQRKRLRKRKLKEATSQRRKIIGPLLPGSNDDIDHVNSRFEVVNNVAEGVRQNAATDVSGEAASCSKKNKLKKRRKYKNLAVAKLTSSSIESGTSNQNQGLKMGTDDRIDP